MTRRLYNIAVVTSLVLFVVVMGLWVASGFGSTVAVVSKPDGEGGTVVMQIHGTIRVHWDRTDKYPTIWTFDYMKNDSFEMLPKQSAFDALPGISYVSLRRSIHIAVPHWLLAILTLILPVVWLIRRRRKPDPDAVPCAKCGYDLRGSPGGACSECGAQTKERR